MSLRKISLTVHPQAEEPVVQLLEKISGQPASVYVDAKTGKTTLTVYLAKPSDWSAREQAALREGLRDLKAFGLQPGSGRIVTAVIRPQNWAESWKRHFKPIEIGRALLLKPSWSKRRGKNNQAVVVLDPGLSFGTGQHPTTRFCVEQLVSVRKRDDAQSFFDIGTGSGILAITAAKLGYRPVAGIDSDPEAVRIARENARKNGVLQKVRLSCRDLATLPRHRGRKYDLICANLTFDLLLKEKQRILCALKPSGVLVLAGILRSQFPEVSAVYEKTGLRLAAFKLEKEWASGAFNR